MKRATFEAAPQPAVGRLGNSSVTQAELQGLDPKLERDRFLLEKGSAHPILRYSSLVLHGLRLLN